MSVLFRIASAFTLTLGAGCSFAATFVVTSYGEEGDFFPGDGVAEVEPGTAIVTLHSAIEEANAFPGPDTIRFDLEPNEYCRPDSEDPDTIMLSYTRPLTPITDLSGGLTITHAGYPLFINGGSMDYSQSETEHRAALVILSAGNTISRIRFRRFEHNFIVIEGEEATGNVIERAGFGTGCELIPPRGSGEDSLVIQGGASGNWIVDTEIIDSEQNGIRITGAGSNNNVVAGNYFGQYGVNSTSVCDFHVDEIEEPTLLEISVGGWGGVLLIRLGVHTPGSWKNRRCRIGAMAC